MIFLFFKINSVKNKPILTALILIQGILRKFCIRWLGL